MRLASQWLFVALAAFSGCAAVAPARFADVPAVVEVEDARPTPVPEKRLETPGTMAHAIGQRILVAGLDPRRSRRAVDVNSRDEVPRSSWFTELAGGPFAGVVYSGNGRPEAPMIVIPRHPESGRSGLVIVDARGIRYELGRDPKDRPNVMTTAAVVASRLVRSIGYRAPETFIIQLRPEDLRLVSTDLGDPPPIAAVREFLGDGPAPQNGVYRATATRWPPGIDLGPTLPEGVREDDSNDRIKHEDRRELRAMRVVRAWLGFPSFGVETLRDVYVGAPGRGHVEHFLVGFEGALGAYASRGAANEPGGQDRALDPSGGRDPQKTLLTLGLGDNARPTDPRYPSLGALSPTVTNDDYETEIVFAPTYKMRPDDAYWVAKRIANVPEFAVRAAVAASAIDSASAERLVSVLMSRREGIVSRAFTDVTPCEVLRVDGESLVVRDLGFSPGRTAAISIAFFDGEGRSIGAPMSLTVTSAIFSVPLPDAPYVVARLRASRGGWVAPRYFDVHMRRRSERDLVVVGVMH